MLLSLVHIPFTGCVKLTYDYHYDIYLPIIKLLLINYIDFYWLMMHKSIKKIVNKLFYTASLGAWGYLIFLSSYPPLGVRGLQNRPLLPLFEERKGWFSLRSFRCKYKIFSLQTIY